MKTLITQFKKLYNSIFLAVLGRFPKSVTKVPYQYQEKISREQYEQELDKIFDFSSVKTIPLNEEEAQDDGFTDESGENIVNYT